MLAMRAYELMSIYTGETEDQQVRDNVAAVTKAIEAEGGKVATSDFWGKRRFAYEINHKWEGYYVVLEIVTAARDLHEVERTLRLADDVVRHKVLRLPDGEAARRGLLGESTPAPAAG